MSDLSQRESAATVEIGNCHKQNGSTRKMNVNVKALTEAAQLKHTQTGL